MIEYVHGDILADESAALVNTVNCVGVMGRGIALQFKKAFPENFKCYEQACRNNLVVPGKMFVYDTGKLMGPRWIINFPTKRHWRGASKIEDIESGLVDLSNQIKALDIRSISIPPLGCGLGGLDWRIVKQLIADRLTGLDGVAIRVHEPDPNAVSVVRNIAVPQLNGSLASYIMLIQGYLKGMMDPIVRLLELHKLAYFQQVFGEELKLNFSKYYYGPYAGNLRFVLNKLEGHYISGYGDGGDDPQKPLRLLPGAVSEAERCLEQYPDTRERIAKVLELVNGFESPDALELMASVHWLVEKEGCRDVDMVMKGLAGWNARKRRFSKMQVEKVLSALKGMKLVA